MDKAKRKRGPRRKMPRIVQGMLPWFAVAREYNRQFAVGREDRITARAAKKIGLAAKAKMLRELEQPGTNRQAAIDRLFQRGGDEG